MPLITSRRVWTQQPQKVIKASFRGKSASFLWLPPTGNTDLANNSTPTETGSSGTGVSSVGIAATTSNNNRLTWAKRSDPTSFTVIYYGFLNSTSASYTAFPFGQFEVNGALSNAAVYDWAIYESWSADEVYMQLSNGSSVVSFSSGVDWKNKRICRIAASFNNGVPKISVNGNLAITGPTLSGGAVTSNRDLASGGYWGNQTTYDPGINTYLAAVFDGVAASDKELQELSNNPWSIFKGQDKRIWVPSAGGGAAALAGNAQAIAAASGALSVSTPVALAGAAVGVVTSTGAISSAMPLSGAAAAVAAASGNLGSGILLAGGAQAQAGASGNITFGLSISGAALAAAVASGVLGTQKPLAGGAQVAVTATGNLQATLPSSLAGGAQAAAAATGQMQMQFSISVAALMQALATGGITVTGSTALAGPAQATAQSTGALSTTIQLAGAAQVVASATGTLALGRPLAGAAVAVSVAGGLLTITTNLAGDGVAQAIASGYMALQIPLSGAALMQAAASGVLSGTSASLNTPKIRLLRVPAEKRRIGHRIR